MTGQDRPEIEPQEALAARRRRNLWLALALGGFVVLVMLVTIIRLSTGTGVSERM